jgi:hypothetical protein
MFLLPNGIHGLFLMAGESKVKFKFFLWRMESVFYDFLKPKHGSVLVIFLHRDDPGEDCNIFFLLIRKSALRSKALCGHILLKRKSLTWYGFNLI